MAEAVCLDRSPWSESVLTKRPANGPVLLPPSAPYGWLVEPTQGLLGDKGLRPIKNRQAVHLNLLAIYLSKVLEYGEFDLTLPFADNDHGIIGIAIVPNYSCAPALSHL